MLTCDWLIRYPWKQAFINRGLVSERALKLPLGVRISLLKGSSELSDTTWVVAKKNWKLILQVQLHQQCVSGSGVP